MTYQQIKLSTGQIDTTVVKRSDGAIIPTNDPRSMDCQKYLRWLAEGNTPDPPDAA